MSTLFRSASAAPGPTPTATLRVGTGNAIVNSVAFSPSGRFLAAGAQDGTVEAWNLASRPPAPIATLSLGKDNPVGSVAFSPDGSTLAAGGTTARSACGTSPPRR
jgi:WD40 repeat protein